MTTTTAQKRQCCSRINCPAGPFGHTTDDYETNTYPGGRRFHLCHNPQSYWVVKLGSKFVGRGFFGNDPERFWTTNPDEAKGFYTREAAERFANSTGDSSWGLQVWAK